MDIEQYTLSRGSDEELTLTMSGEKLVAGTVLQCGATDYWAVGRTKETRLEYPSLAVPHKLKELEVRVPCIERALKYPLSRFVAPLVQDIRTEMDDMYT